MAEALELTEEQRALRDDLEKRVSRFRGDYGTRIKELEEMRDLAVKLHNDLKAAGHEPRHHKYMLENRQCNADDPEFYFHIHPIQDLIAFTYDPQANDDPQDQTIGHEFEIQVFTRRWKHMEKYALTRTESGWFLDANSYTGQCDKRGQPHLFDSLKHDSVRYPRDVGDWFEWLWDQAKKKGLSHEEVQKALDEIAQWIRKTEENAPHAGAWEGLT